MHLLICDDRPDDCEKAREAIEEGMSKGTVCKTLHSTALTTALEAFFDTVNKALKGEATPKTEFDGFDLIVVDNNLTHLAFKGARLTAESIAGYVRAISDTPYIISVNKNPDIDFDLRFLVGDYATRADLALNTRHLANPALWTGSARDAKDGFRPWYWPALNGVADRRRKQIAFVNDQFDRPILSALGFPKSAVNALSRHARGALSPQADSDEAAGKSMSKITFRDYFCSSPRSLPVQEEREQLLKFKNKAAVVRVVAGELDVWFRRDVLGPQDVLVDVPHLLQRMPFILGKRANTLEAWNACVAASIAPFGLEKSTFDEHLASCRADLDAWIQFPAFWWQTVKDSGKLNELFFQSNKDEWGDYIFCEDTSLFSIRPAADGTGPKEFVAEFESPWDRRYVSIVSSKNYSPRSRLAL